ncbi:MAG: hypothetical protein NT029_08280 [Armatimonadetes bacterium]|nr:hypothetical protein [Armatimonadota bacterium]
MSRIVFVLGAGASAEAGAPMMKDFLDKADWCRTNRKVRDPADFDLVFDAIHRMDATMAKGHVDRDNLESLYGLFEMAELTGRVPGLDPAKARDLTQALRTVIAQTLEESIKHPVRRAVAEAPEPFGRFVDLACGEERAWRQSVSFMTFNYDLCLDYALLMRGVRCWSSPTEGATPQGWVDLMKLHGSLNWRREEAGTVTEVPIRAVKRPFDVDGSDVYVPWSELLGESPSGHDPFIVPPTWNKGEYHKAIAPVWRRAAAHLAEAEYVGFIGFSLPEADAFVPALFALGTEGPAKLKRVAVFDPAESVDERYRQMLGLSMRARLVGHRMSFSEALRVRRSRGGDVAAGGIADDLADILGEVPQRRRVTGG